MFLVCVVLIGTRRKFLMGVFLGFALDLAVELSMSSPLIDYVNSTAAPYWHLAVGLVLFGTSFLVVWLNSEKFKGKSSRTGGDNPEVVVQPLGRPLKPKCEAKGSGHTS